MLTLGGSWGISAFDVWTNVMSVVGTVAPFILLWVAYAYSPRIFNLIRNSVEELQARNYEKKYRRRGYYYMNQDQIDQYERSIRFKPWKW